MKRAIRRVMMPPATPILLAVVAFIIDRTVWRTDPLGEPANLASGAFIIAIGVFIVVRSVSAFRKHHESLDVARPTQTLVTDGIYSTSRNPVYLSFLIFTVGFGCLANASALMFAVIPSFAVLNFYTIPIEERYLSRTLPRQYAAYTAKVRRWL